MMFENYNRGTDLVQNSVSFSLGGRYIENLTLTGSSNINGTGAREGAIGFGAVEYGGRTLAKLAHRLAKRRGA